jgi:hypothetical protein
MFARRAQGLSSFSRPTDFEMSLIYQVSALCTCWQQYAMLHTFSKYNNQILAA